MRSSVSAMRSSTTTMLRLLASKEVGSPSSSKLFRNISRAGQNRVAGRTWAAGRVLHMVDLKYQMLLRDQGICAMDCCDYLEQL